jgi:hypothetical protein
MYVAVIHTIHDTARWAERMEAFETATLPEGCTNPISYIDDDTELAFCLFDCRDMDELQEWLDAFMGPASSQRYFEVDPTAPGTFGIPAHMTG